MSVFPSLVIFLLIAFGFFIWRSHWFHAQRKKQLVQRALTANAGLNPVVSAAISPSGKQLAYFETADGLSLLQIDTGEMRSLPRDSKLLPLNWFPDEAHLLVTPLVGPGIARMSTADGTKRNVSDEDFVAVALSPDGRQIAYVPSSKPSEIWLMGAEGDSAHFIVSVKPAFVFALAWSPTSRRIVYLTYSGNNQITDKLGIESCERESGQRTPILSDSGLEGPIGFSDLLWSADGRVLYRLKEPAPNPDSTNIWSVPVDPDSGRLQGNPSRVTSEIGYIHGNFSESTDGKRLAFGRMRYRDTVRVAEIRRGGEELGTPQSILEDNWSKELEGWTNDSQSVLFRSNPQGKWGIFKQNVRTHEAQSLMTGPDRYFDPVLSPDGQWLLFTQSPHDNQDGNAARLMRVSINGGPATEVLTGNFSYRCALKANVCVLSEVSQTKQEFWYFEPLKGRGNAITQTIPTHDARSGWSLSPDGLSIATVSADSENGHIQIIPTSNGSTRTIDLSGFKPYSLNWSNDNQHLYVAGLSGSTYHILWVGLDGKFKSLLELPSYQGWMGDPRVSPDGRYLAYFLRIDEKNVALLENY